MTAFPGYWCDYRLVVTVDGPDGHSPFAIDKPFARIGSHGSGEVVLPNRKVPRRWLYFHASPYGVFWIKLSRSDSAERYTQGWLDPGQLLVYGDYRIGARLVNADAVASPSTNLTADGSAELPCPAIALWSNGSVIARHVVTRRLTLIGRRPPATVELADRSVSHCHCALYWDSGTLWVIDLLSSNGTKHAGERVEVATLSQGECLSLGGIDLTFDGLRGGEGPGGREAPQALEREELLAPVSEEPEEYDLSELADPEDAEPEGPDLTELDEMAKLIEPGLEQESSALQAAQDTFEGQKREWQARIEETRAELQRHSIDLEHRSVELAAERTEFESQQARWEEAKAEFAREQVAARADLERREQQVDAALSELREAREEFARDQSATKAELQQRFHQLDAEFATLREDRTELERRLSSLEEQQRNHEQQQIDLAAEWERLQSERFQFQSERESWLAEREQIMTEIVATRPRCLSSDASEEEEIAFVSPVSTLTAPLGAAEAEPVVKMRSPSRTGDAAECPAASERSMAACRSSRNPDADRIDDQDRIRDALAAFHRQKQKGLMASLLQIFRRAES